MRYANAPMNPPSWQGDVNQPPEGVGGGIRRNALAQLSGPGPAMPGAVAPGAGPGMAQRQGYYDYLKSQGYTGEMGPDMRAFAQQLRASGEHPFLDYWHSQHPAGMGMGGNGPGGVRPSPGLPSWQNGQGYGPPHTMTPPMLPPQGIAVGEPNGQNALAALAGARRVPFVRR